MATAINIAQTSTAGKKLNKAIADINPNVSNGVLNTFASRLNALTTNDFGGVTKVTKEEIESVTYYDLTIETNFLNNDNGCLSWNATTKILTVDKSKIPANSWNVATNPYVNFKLKANNTYVTTFEYASNSPAGEFASPISIQPGGDGLSVAAVSEDDTTPITIKILAGRYSTVNYNSTTITIQIV